MDEAEQVYSSDAMCIKIFNGIFKFLRIEQAEEPRGK